LYAASVYIRAACCVVEDEEAAEAPAQPAGTTLQFKV
jgi:hypothetical protein